MRKQPVEERFWDKVDKDGPVPEFAPHLGPCWLWAAGRSSNGYGYIRDGNHVGAHRVAYQICVGPIPDGLVLDHLCRVRHCVNPHHLEPVVQRENVMRSPIAAAALNAAKVRCDVCGSEFVFAKSGKRYCPQCKILYERAKRAAS